MKCIACIGVKQPEEVEGSGNMGNWRMWWYGILKEVLVWRFKGSGCEDNLKDVMIWINE